MPTQKVREQDINKIKLRDLLKVVEFDEKIFLRVPALFKSIKLTEISKLTGGMPF